MAKKIEANPQALEKLKNDDELAAKIQKNPKLLVDLLDGKDINALNQSEQTQTPQNSTLSPMNSQIINSKTSSLNQNSDNNSLDNNSLNKTNQPEENNTQNVTSDNVTYIPSSDFVAKDETISQEQKQAYDEILAQSDKVLKRAEKFI